MKTDTFVKNGKLGNLYYVDFDGDGEWDCQFLYIDGRFNGYKCRQMAKQSIDMYTTESRSLNVRLTSQEITIEPNSSLNVDHFQLVVCEYNGKILNTFSIKENFHSYQFQDELKSGFYIVYIIQHNSISDIFKFSLIN